MYVAAQIISLYLSRPNVVSRECRLLVYIWILVFFFLLKIKKSEL